MTWLWVLLAFLVGAGLMSGIAFLAVCEFFKELFRR